MHIKRWDHAGYMGSFETVFYRETAVKKKKPVTKVPQIGQWQAVWLSQVKILESR